MNLGSKLNCDRPVVSSWHVGNVGECCGDKDEDDDMDDGGGVVVAEAAVEHSVKIPIFGRDKIWSLFSLHLLRLLQLQSWRQAHT